MPAVARNGAIELFRRNHPVVHRPTAGRLLGRIGGVPELLLVTRGRRSGMPHTKPLLFLAHWRA